MKVIPSCPLTDVIPLPHLVFVNRQNKSPLSSVSYMFSLCHSNSAFALCCSRFYALYNFSCLNMLRVALFFLFLLSIPCVVYTDLLLYFFLVSLYASPYWLCGRLYLLCCISALLNYFSGIFSCDTPGITGPGPVIAVVMVKSTLNWWCAADASSSVPAHGVQFLMRQREEKKAQQCSSAVSYLEERNHETKKENESSNTKWEFQF